MTDLVLQRKSWYSYSTPVNGEQKGATAYEVSVQ